MSYVLNGGPRPVADSTRERVLRSVAELGYRPDGIARALAARRTHSLGLLVPDNGNPYFAQLSHAVEDAAFARGYSVLLGNAADDVGREVAYVRTFLERQVDGLLLISVRSWPDLRDILDPGTPTVVLDRPAPGVHARFVAIDNLKAAAAGTAHLVEHGHDRIACIAGPPGTGTADQRRDGWRQALHDAHLPSAASQLAEAPFTRYGGYQATIRLLQQRQRPTALFVSSDAQAVGALRAAHDLDLTAPTDLAMVSLDDIDESAYTQPGLTVIRQPVAQIADLAVQRLIDRMYQPDQPADHTILPFHLVRRGSCGCPDTPPRARRMPPRLS